jgi:hypothetical protein
VVARNSGHCFFEQGDIWLFDPNQIRNVLEWDTSRI